MPYNLVNIWNKYNNIYKQDWKSRFCYTQYNLIDIDWVETGSEIESFHTQIGNLIQTIKTLEPCNGIRGILFFHTLIFPSVELISMLNKDEFILVGWCDEKLGYIDKSYIGKNNVNIIKSQKWRYNIEVALLSYYDMIFCENDKIKKILHKHYHRLAQYRKVQVVGLPHIKYKKYIGSIEEKENIIVFPYYADYLDGYELFNLAKSIASPQLKEKYEWIRISPSHPDYFKVLRKAKFGLSFNRRFGNDFGVRDCIASKVLVFCPKKKYRKKSAYNNLLSNLQYKTFDHCIEKLVNAINNEISYRAYKGILNRLRKKLKVEENWTFRKIIKTLNKLVLKKTTL